MREKPKRKRFQGAIHFASTMLIHKAYFGGLILPSLLGLCAFCCEGATNSPICVLTKVGHQERVHLNGGKDFTIEVVQDTNHLADSFSEDWLLFRIKNTAGVVVAKKAFHSTYQQFRIDALDLDGDGDDELVVTTGEGRGTSVRKEILSIEQVESGRLRTILSLPVSEYYESGKKWWYEVSFRGVGNKNGHGIEMNLNADDQSGFEHAPRDRTIEIKWRSVPERSNSATREIDLAVPQRAGSEPNKPTNEGKGKGS